jgi:hypothetical protein
LSDLGNVLDLADRLLEEIDRIGETTAAVPIDIIGSVLQTIRPLGEVDIRDPSAASSHILVVDDNASNRDLLSRRLVREGYRVTAAASGAAALALTATESFDLLLLYRSAICISAKKSSSSFLRVPRKKAFSKQQRASVPASAAIPLCAIRIVPWKFERVRIKRAIPTTSRTVTVPDGWNSRRMRWPVRFTSSANTNHVAWIFRRSAMIGSISRERKPTLFKLLSVLNCIQSGGRNEWRDPAIWAASMRDQSALSSG